MLTEKQIKNLKDGDIVYLNHYPLTFKAVSDDLNTISATDDASTCGEGDLCWFTRQYLTVKPKYDPYRWFKKGDEVRVVAWNGRDIARIGQIGRVVSDEHNSSVELAIDGWTSSVYYPACHLELVTPVEELEPYYVEEETFDYEIRNANDDPDIGTSLAFHIKFQDPDEGQILSVKSYYESYVYSREHAEADAEAERDRLNEEWRKELNKG